MSQTDKKKLSFFQIFNMSVGFFGIQFGWALQMTNMSAIFEHLGARADEIPILWLAAPLTGLIVQPVVGQMSDRTWGKLGRRRPYFLVGAILSSIALIFMPNSSTLWIAAGSLWILDTANNVSMQPFRALVTDLLPESQQTLGFVVQSLLTGLGAVVAAILPWTLSHLFDVTNVGIDRAIPPNIEISFYVGAAVFMGTILWTVATTEEYPPDDPDALAEQVEASSFRENFDDMLDAVREMPETMRQLAWVQFFSWLGIYCFFLYFPPAVARNFFGATEQGSQLYSEGIEWAGVCIAVFNAVCVLASFVIPYFVNLTNRKIAHAFCLFAGATGLISLWFIERPVLILVSVIGLGIAWASLLSLPYAMVSSALPEDRIGIYMGIYNAFVVLPEIAASLGLGWVVSHFLHNDRLLAVVAGGVSMLVGAILVPQVRDSEDIGDLSEPASIENS
ncbi:MFS transporter [Geitlerinema sp. CS-897]|uniref:MFS transporter n=1 Tax=Baaleninema simplex TaxID=2862350 RepID=UPI00034D93AC|nr:MFS transporter [Baaleninema simplex]MDC0835830.1 MFS transporter [Geitlerinema sp. CS-897]